MLISSKVMQRFGIALFEGNFHPFAKEPMEHDGLLFAVFIRANWSENGPQQCRAAEVVDRKEKQHEEEGWKTWVSRRKMERKQQQQRLVHCGPRDEGKDRRHSRCSQRINVTLHLWNQAIDGISETDGWREVLAVNTGRCWGWRRLVGMEKGG